MTGKSEDSALVCRTRSCSRKAALDPPYCCVPCEVFATHDVPEHQHSVTCVRLNPREAS